MSTFDTPRSASIAWSAAWNSTGKSSEPTPMMAPCPGMSRGTDWTVPMVPGLVSVMVAPAKSSGVSLLERTLRMRAS